MLILLNVNVIFQLEKRELEIPPFSVDKLSSWTSSENLGGQFANFLLVEIHMFSL